LDGHPGLLVALRLDRYGRQSSFLQVRDQRCTDAGILNEDRVGLVGGRVRGVALDNLRLFPSGAKLANFDKPTEPLPGQKWCSIGCEGLRRKIVTPSGRT
jgi:hypothetical protein